MPMVNDGLSERAGELLTQGPHGLGNLGEGDFRIGQLGLQVIDPLIKIVMEMLAQGGPLFACTCFI